MIVERRQFELRTEGGGPRSEDRGRTPEVRSRTSNVGSNALLKINAGYVESNSSGPHARDIRATPGQKRGLTILWVQPLRGRKIGLRTLPYHPAENLGNDLCLLIPA